MSNASNSQNTLVLTQEEVKDICCSFLHEKDCDLLKYDIARCSSAGPGFMGVHYSIEASARDSKGKTHSLHFFAKEKPRGSPEDTELLNGIQAYEKEAGVYQHLMDAFLDNAPEAHTDFAPRAHLIRPTLIVLDDVIKRDYRPVGDWVKGVDLRVIELTMEALASLHAASIAWEERMGKTLLSSYREMLIEPFFDNTRGEDFVGWRCAKSASTTIEDLIPDALGEPEGSPAVEQARQDLYQLTEEALPKAIGQSSKYRNVLSHGDIWPSNIMLRKDSNGKPEKVMLVDFQMVRYTSPAWDISMFLHFALPKDELAIHEEKLLRVYHSAFGGCLKAYGLDVHCIYTVQDLFKNYKEIESAVHLQRCMYIPTIALPMEEMSTLISSGRSFNDFALNDRRTLIRKAMGHSPEYKYAVIDCVRDLLKSLR